MATATTRPDQADAERRAASSGRPRARLLTRPDIGAFVGAVAVFLAFA